MVPIPSRPRPVERENVEDQENLDPRRLQENETNKFNYIMKSSEDLKLELQEFRVNHQDEEVVLGVGQFSYVFRVQHKSGKIFAIKTVT